MQNSEKEILNIIKFLPVVLILTVSFLLTYFLYSEIMDRFEKESKELESKYISLNKDLIRYQVQKIKNKILEEKDNKVTVLKKEVKNQVLNAHNIAYSIYKNNQDKSKEEIISLIKDALREIRFNDGRGYLFIYENLGNVILHPIKPTLEGRNLWNYQDKRGTYLLQEMHKILQKQDDTYYSWYWTKPDGGNNEFEKLGYFKKFEPYGWFIGTGEYIYDFKENLRQKLLTEIMNFKYSEDGYVFVINHEGTYLSYHDKSYLGKNVYDLYMSDDVANVHSRLIELAKNGGGYINYNHNDKPVTDEKVSKISYIDGIDDWKWIIGTGFYMDDFYNQIEEKKRKLSIENNIALQKLLIISFLSTVFVLVLFMYISSVLENKFKRYKESIANQINDNIKKDNMLAYQSKMAAMGEMIANIAHQWRQPLSTISTIVTGIKVQKDMGIKDESLEKESLEKINKHIQYLSHTIDDFRNFFKSDKEPQLFDMSEMIEKTLELVEAQLKSKNIIIIREIDNVKVESLENELIQVLINLLNNARDELLKIEGSKLLFIKLKKDEKNAILTIEDNAGGVKEEIIDRIFEPYFTTKQQSQGTGIGLFMSEEIIVKHLNGTICVKNKNIKYDKKDYKCASFKITIPLKLIKTNVGLS